MKNIIYLNYNLDVNVNNNSNDVYSFYIDYVKYYFIKVKRPIEDINHINELLSLQKNYYHLIVKTVNNTLFSKVEKNNYVLLKLNYPENDEITLDDIIKNQIKVENINKSLKRNSWSSLWERKNDYLEYQISELAKNHTTAISSFSYYLALAENTIAYFNLTDKNGELSLNQKRIIYPNYSLNYFNPLNLIIDYRVRDVAEYIKVCFWNKKDAIGEVKKIINKNIYSSSEYNLLFVRILYPSNYFDDLQLVLENNKDDDILLKYVERAEEYRLFLKDVFYLITKKAPLMNIDWITKEH